MPFKPARPCRRPGCSGVTRDRSGYCEKHKRRSISESYARQEHADWYHTTAWRKAREWHLRHNPLCVRCGRAANHVDHKNKFTDWESFMDPDNLQSLCKHCHAVKSGEKGK